jgi:hypothetical protein
MLSLEDNIISALDDYAEYVLGSDFSGKITQKEAVDFILESLADRISEEEVRLYKAFKDSLEIQKGVKFMADRMMNHTQRNVYKSGAC